MTFRALDAFILPHRLFVPVEKFEMRHNELTARVSSVIIVISKIEFHGSRLSPVALADVEGGGHQYPPVEIRSERVSPLVCPDNIKADAQVCRIDFKIEHSSAKRDSLVFSVVGLMGRRQDPPSGLDRSAGQ